MISSSPRQQQQTKGKNMEQETLNKIAELRTWKDGRSGGKVAVWSGPEVKALERVAVQYYRDQRIDWHRLRQCEPEFWKLITEDAGRISTQITTMARRLLSAAGYRFRAQRGPYRKFVDDAVGNQPAAPTPPPPPPETRQPRPRPTPPPPKPTAQEEKHPHFCPNCGFNLTPVVASLNI